MRRLTTGRVAISLLAALTLFTVAADCRAGTILIDFEQFSNGYNLQGVNLGGVTLTNPSGKVEIYENRFGVGSHSGTKAIASANGLVSVNPLVGVFDGAVSSVSLWGGDAGTYLEADSWELLAFDARTAGSVVGRVSSGSWNGSPYRQLSISAPQIWRFEANWTGPKFGIGYDDLRFVTVPPPPPPTPETDLGPGPNPPPAAPLPSNGSFDGGVDEDLLTIDFGELELGASASPVSFNLWNLPSSGPTAALNFSNFDKSGNADVFGTTLAPFSGLAPSDSRVFLASINTTATGKFSATYELHVSDTTGTLQQPLRLVFIGEVVPEPSSVVLAAAGLLSFLGWGWRRRKAR